MCSSRSISFAYFTRNNRNDIFVTTLNTLNLLYIRAVEIIFICHNREILTVVILITLVIIVLNIFLRLKLFNVTTIISGQHNFSLIQRPGQ